MAEGAAVDAVVDGAFTEDAEVENFDTAPVSKSKVKIFSSSKTIKSVPLSGRSVFGM